MYHHEDTRLPSPASPDIVIFIDRMVFDKPFANVQP